MSSNTSLFLEQEDDGKSLTASAPLYLRTDGLGSVRVEMTGGNATANTSYGPYGSIHQQTGTSQTSYGYTGEQFHAGTGLLYLRARYYNPNLHQFMGRDPWSGNSRNPRTLNLYVYAYGNPLLYTDPTGRCGQLPDGTPLCPTGGTVSSGSGASEGLSVLSHNDSWKRLSLLGWWNIFVYKRVGYTAVFLEKTVDLACSSNLGPTPFTAGGSASNVDGVRWKAPSLSDLTRGSATRERYNHDEGSANVGWGINENLELELYGGLSSNGSGFGGASGTLGPVDVGIEMGDGEGELSFSLGVDPPVQPCVFSSSGSTGVQWALRDEVWVAVPNLVSQGIDPDVLAEQEFSGLISSQGKISHKYHRTAHSFNAGQKTAMSALHWEHGNRRFAIPTGQSVWFPFEDHEDGFHNGFVMGQGTPACYPLP